MRWLSLCGLIALVGLAGYGIGWFLSQLGDASLEAAVGRPELDGRSLVELDHGQRQWTTGDAAELRDNGTEMLTEVAAITGWDLGDKMQDRFEGHYLAGYDIDEGMHYVLQGTEARSTIDQPQPCQHLSVLWPDFRDAGWTITSQRLEHLEPGYPVANPLSDTTDVRLVNDAWVIDVVVEESSPRLHLHIWSGRSAARNRDMPIGDDALRQCVAAERAR